MVNNRVAACNWIVAKGVPTQRLTLRLSASQTVFWRHPLSRQGLGGEDKTLETALRTCFLLYCLCNPCREVLFLRLCKSKTHPEPNRSKFFQIDKHLPVTLCAPFHEFFPSITSTLSTQQSMHIYHQYHVVINSQHIKLFA